MTGDLGEARASLGQVISPTAFAAAEAGATRVALAGLAGDGGLLTAGADAVVISESLSPPIAQVPSTPADYRLSGRAILGRLDDSSAGSRGFELAVGGFADTDLLLSVSFLDGVALGADPGAISVEITLDALFQDVQLTLAYELEAEDIADGEGILVPLSALPAPPSGLEQVLFIAEIRFALEERAPGSQLSLRYRVALRASEAPASVLGGTLSLLVAIGGLGRRR